MVDEDSKATDVQHVQQSVYFISACVVVCLVCHVFMRACVSVCLCDGGQHIW